MSRLTKRITESTIELSAKANPFQYNGSPQSVHIKHPFWNVFDRLCKYEDKEEQGLLISVPVKPEDDIYFIKLHFNGTSRLGKITVDKITIDAFEIRVRGFWYDWNQEVSFTLKEFNKTWFLTEAEAESALAKMGGK